MNSDSEWKDLIADVMDVSPERVEWALSKLNPTDRLVAEYLSDGNTAADISRMMNVSRERIGQRRARIRRKLSYYLSARRFEVAELMHSGPRLSA